MRKLLIALLLFTCSQAHAASITVSNTADSFDMGGTGPCSLRDAIQSVNNNAAFGGCSPSGGGAIDTVILTATTPYTLTIDGPSDNTNATGDLDVVDNDISIVGPAGSSQTTIQAAFSSGNEDRVIHFINVSKASVTGVTITGGDVLAILEIGGGILAETGELNLTEVQILSNKAEFGGGIYAPCGTTILDSLIQGNLAHTDSGNGTGGGMDLAEQNCGTSSVTVDNTRILGNHADAEGGGIFIQRAPVMILTNSIVDGNIIDTPDGTGGGIFIQGGDGNGSAYIANSAITRNDGGFAGGGIFSDEGNLVVVNSTVSNNKAVVYGAGIASNVETNGSPDSLFLGGFTSLFNVTVAENQASNPSSYGAGICSNCDRLIPFGGTTIDNFFLWNTLVAKNTTPSGDNPDCRSFNFFNTQGFNLIGIDSIQRNCFQAPGTGDQVGTQSSPIDAKIGALQLNGGSTETHGLLTGSPAIDKANNNVTGCQAPDFQDLFQGTVTLVDLSDDQRHFLRPIAILDPNTPICDIGAFEFQAFNFNVTKDDGLGGATIPVGTVFTYTITVTNTGPGTATAVTLSDPLPNGMAFDSFITSQGTCTGGAIINCALGDLAVGDTATITVTVTATEAGTFTNIATITVTDPSQQQVTKTAQVITTVQGGIIEGSGILPCSLQRGAINPSPRLGWAMGLMVLTLLGIYTTLRKKSSF